MDKDAQRFNKTLLNIPISQKEYDIYMDFTYQYGTGAWSKSAMPTNLKLGRYEQACKSLLFIDTLQSVIALFDQGVWTRQKERYDNCMGAQQMYQIYTIIALVILSLIQFGYYSNMKKDQDLIEAKTIQKYEEKQAQEAKIQPEAFAKQQTTINKLSSDYETEKAKHKVKTEIVTQ